MNGVQMAAAVVINAVLLPGHIICATLATPHAAAYGTGLGGAHEERFDSAKLKLRSLYRRKLREERKEKKEKKRARRGWRSDDSGDEDSDSKRR